MWKANYRSNNLQNQDPRPATSSSPKSHIDIDQPLSTSNWIDETTPGTTEPTEVDGGADTPELQIMMSANQVHQSSPNSHMDFDQPPPVSSAMDETPTADRIEVVGQPMNESYGREMELLVLDVICFLCGWDITLVAIFEFFFA